MEKLVERWREEVALYRRRGLDKEANMLESAVNELEEYLEEEREKTLTVPEAAALTGVHPETIRRAVRRNEIADSREGGKGIIRVRAADLGRLSSKARSKNPKAGSFDPAAFARLAA